MFQSRLAEFTRRVVREDMLTLFSHTGKIEGLEMSIILDPTQVFSSNDLKYKAACILSVLTGNRPAYGSCSNKHDPLSKTTAEEEAKQWNMVKTAMIRKTQATQKKNQKTNTKDAKAAKAAAAQEEKEFSTKMSSAKLKCDLHGLPMWAWLEKMRELYLPDLVSIDEDPVHMNCNSDNCKLPVQQQFVTPTKSISPVYPPFQPIKDRNPWSAVATFALPSTEIIKFPDIEENFEAFSSILNKESNINIIIRAKMAIEKRKDAESINKLKIMNYLLAIYFNPYMKRV